MFGNNIYYNPEKFNLEVMGEIEWSEPNYDFDMTVVWKSKRGQYWVGSDSGCSCPSPFEDFKGVEDLDGPYDKRALRTQLNHMIRNKNDRSYGYGEAELRKQAGSILGRIK